MYVAVDPVTDICRNCHVDHPSVVYRTNTFSEALGAALSVAVTVTAPAPCVSWLSIAPVIVTGAPSVYIATYSTESPSPLPDARPRSV